LAYTEKLRILYELKRYEDLKAFVLKHHKKMTKDNNYYTLTALCYWELNDYIESAKAWENAFKIISENGVYAANAANAYEFAGKKKEALKLYIEAVKIFISQDNNAELTALVPKLTALGGRNKEARTLLAAMPAKKPARSGTQ
jgi:tetratricopeptide (TPR) repeat protein